MTSRALSVAIAVLAVVVFVAAPVLAAETHKGTVVSAAGGKLTMTDEDGNEHAHNVPTTAKITLDGKAAKLADLKKGFKVEVTIDQVDGKDQVTAIAAKSK
jgi:Cu/Ag efflux protein CusF